MGRWLVLVEGSSPELLKQKAILIGGGMIHEFPITVMDGFF
jgi:hypothetical protein